MDELTLFNLIKDNKLDHIHQIMDYTDKSESTIRRSLHKLKDDGFINLIYGGKFEVIKDTKLSISDAYKNDKLIVSKNKICKQAVSVIEDGDIIFIDNGTTVRNMFKYIKDLNVTIYTNGYNHIALAWENNIDIKLIPGDILFKEASIVGEEAISFISDITFDKVFIGANGYSINDGITTPNLTEYNLKKTLIKRSIKSYILIDKTKEGLVSKYKVADTLDVNIITD